MQSLEISVQELAKKVEKLEKGINSLTQVYLENQSWSNKEDLSGQLKPIREILQKIKEALVE